MRIVGINIPDNKKVEIALSYIYGVGRASAKKIITATKIQNKFAKELTPDEVNKIQGYLEKSMRVEGHLRQDIKQNISRLKEIQCYRGVRHMKKLPVHGQRTKTNSRTIRGNVRKTAGSGKRKVELR